MTVWPALFSYPRSNECFCTELTELQIKQIKSGAYIMGRRKIGRLKGCGRRAKLAKAVDRRLIDSGLINPKIFLTQGVVRLG